MFAPARAAKHNLDWKNDPASGVRQFTALDAIEELACSNSAHLLRRLTYNSEWWRSCFGHVKVVEANKGQIGWHLQSQVQNRAQDITRRQGIRRKDGRRRVLSSHLFLQGQQGIFL